MSNVLSLEKQQQIQTLSRLGWSDRQISRELGVHRKTVNRYKEEVQSVPEVSTDSKVHSNENVPKVPTDPSPPPTKSPHLLGKQLLVQTLFDQGHTAQRIYQDLVEEHDYQGTYDSVKRYVRKLRKSVKRYHDRLPHLPGREAQVDFGLSTCMVKKGKKYRKMWLFKMTLSCSKHSYEELVESQDIATFIQCHINAFKFFGGVPEIITLDNLKSGVLQASLYEPELNPVYRSFCKHYNVIANPCKPYTPEHKGIVERDIQYTKSNALAGKRFESLLEANLYLRHWNKRWARTRIHGSTKKQVWKHFVEVEQPMLKSLPQKRFELFECGSRKVDVNGCVEVKGNFYGVPYQLVGERVIVHFNNTWIKVYKDENLQIRHTRIHGKGKVNIPNSCQPHWKHPTRESQERYYCNKAKSVGPNTHDHVYNMLLPNDPMAIRKVRGIMSLIGQFKKGEMERASYEALKYHKYSYNFVKGICESIRKRIDLGSSKVELLQHHEAIRPLSEYQNIINERCF